MHPSGSPFSTNTPAPRRIGSRSFAMLGLTDSRSRAATVPLERDDTRRASPAWFTTRPETYRQKLINSAAVWLGLMACWVVADVLLAMFPAAPIGRRIGPEGWGAL